MFPGMKICTGWFSRNGGRLFNLGMDMGRKLIPGESAKRVHLWHHKAIPGLPFFWKSVCCMWWSFFIVLSILRGWGIDKKAPDLYDWNGALVCLAVASMNLFATNHQGYFLYLFILNDRVVLLICGVTIERRPHPYHWQSQTLSI